MEDFLKQLISFKTVSVVDDAQEFSKLFNYVNDQLKGLDLTHQTFESQQVVSHLWSTVKNPEILLAAHIDVVPAENQQFEATVKDGKLYGRGAIDMKFAVAIFIWLLNKLPDLKTRSIGLLLTSDEEKGGQNGSEYVLKTSKLQPKLVLLPDAAPNMKVEHAEKGVWQLRLKATGKSGHGSRPWLGQNAIDKLIDAYQLLRNKFPNPQTDLWQITVNAGKINGGSATNVISAEASLDLDIRCPDEKSLIEVKQYLNQIIKDHSLSVETLLEIGPYYLPADNTYLKQYLEVGQQVLGSAIELYQSAGASDARFYAEKNIPVILHSPIGGNQHTQEEWIDLASLKTYAQIVEQFLSSLKSVL